MKYTFFENHSHCNFNRYSKQLVGKSGASNLKAGFPCVSIGWYWSELVPWGKHGACWLNSKRIGARMCLTLLSVSADKGWPSPKAFRKTAYSGVDHWGGGAQLNLGGVLLNPNIPNLLHRFSVSSFSRSVRSGLSGRSPTCRG